jgi:hypothetical protein
MNEISSTRVLFPTPYPEVNVIVRRLCNDAINVLNESFYGLYLHGSLALGGFNLLTSDIDFLVVTESNLSNDLFNKLKSMHTILSSCGIRWSNKIEGAYIPKTDLRQHDPAHPPIPWLGVDGHFALEGLGPDWIIQRWILREKGISVVGPPLKCLIDPVSPDDLRQAVRGSLHEWWSPPFPSPERFQIGEYQAYAVLTMCRSLFVLENGRMASKLEAAFWAEGAVGEPWEKLIGEAISWKPGVQFNKLKETLGFIYFTLGRCIH